MNIQTYFKLKIIPSLRKIYGETNVQAVSIPGWTGISGVILNPGNLANFSFSIDEDTLGLFVKVGLNRTDMQSESHRTENPDTITDIITTYIDKFKGIESFGRTRMRAEVYESEKGTLTGVNPTEYNGISDLNTENDDEEFGKDDELEIKELA